MFSGVFNGLADLATDAFQRAMRYDYDAGGRLTDMHGATVFANIGVHYGYDNADRINAVIGPNGRQTTYSYNNLDQLLTETRPADAQGPRSFSYTYDEFDRLWTATDARQQQVVYQYDLLDRVKKVIHPGGEDNFAYHSRRHPNQLSLGQDGRAAAAHRRRQPSLCAWRRPAGPD